jgi:uncharacterized protein
MSRELANVVALDRFALSFGEAARLELPVRPAALELGGHRYEPAPATIQCRLDVSRTSAGYALRLRFELELAGPCMRCLGPASPALEIDAREVDQPAAGDEELRSPYVEHGQLDLAAWAHDAIALAAPQTLLCREDCLGLCPVCGASLNDADPEEHRHESGGDPRWAKLRELQ